MTLKPLFVCSLFLNDLPQPDQFSTLSQATQLGLVLVFLYLKVNIPSFSKVLHNPTLLFCSAAFDLLVKPQIKLLEGPSLRCVEMVYEELVKICHNCTSPVRKFFSAIDISPG